MSFHYIKRSSSAAVHRRGVSFVPAGKKPPLGQGGRFRALKASLAARGARNPGAVAAYIGRKKYGASKFAKLAARGRRRAG